MRHINFEKSFKNKRITGFNSTVFLFLVVFTFLYIFLESYFYPGVLKKYIFFDSKLFAVASAAAALFLSNKKYLKFFKYPFLIGFPIYLTMQLLEALNFRNYIFSNFHLQPAVFFDAVVFSGVLYLVSCLDTVKENIYIWVVFFLLFIVNGPKVIDQAIYSNLYIATHLNFTYDSKMSERWGIYYDYMLFVKKNTPENAKIMVPPKISPWLTFGNIGLDRYFLYPRTLSNGEKNSVENASEFDYVMITWGEGDDQHNPLNYGWPKTDITAEKIIYYDPQTRDLKEILGSYNPKESTKLGVWGLIKVKK